MYLEYGLCRLRYIQNIPEGRVIHIHIHYIYLYGYNERLSLIFFRDYVRDEKKKE